MSLDLNRLERQLRDALAVWRRPAAAPARGADGELPGILDAAAELCAEPTWRALAARMGDGRAEALALWGRALGIEQSSAAARLEQAVLWRAPHPEIGGELEAAPSLRLLRAALLRSPSEARLAGLAAALVESSAELSAAVGRGLVERRARARRSAGLGSLGRARGLVGAELGCSVALGLLEQTEPMAAEIRPATWWQGVRQAVGREAHDGWPAALSARWLASLFRATALERVPRLTLGPLPEPWGASSFARALGLFGVALLDAGREVCPSFAEHQLPHGVRRHVRFALFGGLCAERSFARRELRLGAERARSHQRAVARAMLRWLRLGALRVLCVEALAVEGRAAAEQRFAELAPAAFGRSAPTALLGVVPELRPAARAELVGHVLGASERQRLVEEFGEDWYRNPRFAAALRASDLGPAPPGALEPNMVGAGLRALVQAFAQAL